MERPKRKAINFDLDTTVMREIGMYPDGYRALGVSLKKYGFEEHRQGSDMLPKIK